MKFKATNLLIVLYLLKVSVKWPSENYPRERELNNDLAALGVALVRGTYTQMATAIFKIKPLKQSIIQCLLKELSRECANLTSKKNPSILRKTSTDMRNFKLENVAKELSTRAPLLYSTLLTTAVRDQVKTTLPSVALAACILLKERYLLFQINALLTPCEAHELKWNRSVNNHGAAGCNVPLDLDLEHDNNYIKEANRKMGRNLTTTAVTRNCSCCKVARELVELFDSECKIKKRSGKHVQRSDAQDLRILVNLLLSEEALTETPGRNYNHYTGFLRSQTSNIDMSSLFKWINKHKKLISLNRKAR